MTKISDAIRNINYILDIDYIPEDIKTYKSIPDKKIRKKALNLLKQRKETFEQLRLQKLKYFE